MNSLPVHERTKQLFRKFVVLSRSQVFALLGQSLKERSIYYHLERLISERFIVPEIGLYRHDKLYIATLQALSAVPNQGLIPSQSQNLLEIGHRVACNDVAIALASRSHVSGIALEHELIRIGARSPIIDRRPDGLLKVALAGKELVTLAIEVEATKRSKERIRQVIENYRRTFRTYPNRVAGVLIAANGPRIADLYREEVKREHADLAYRFVVSEDLALKNVQESVLGRPLNHPFDNPENPLQLVCTDCKDGTPIFDLSAPGEIRGTHRENRTRLS